MTLVLYYHELADDDSPLCVSPELFSAHLDVLASCGATMLTAGELADTLRRGEAPEAAVVLTFDDGFRSAVREARARLDAAGMRATFFCVAGHLGGRSDWPSRLPGAPVRPLATAPELAALASEGHEIGSHGWLHEPLARDADLPRELVESRDVLAAECDAEVRTFAYPYGAEPTAAARQLVEETYDAGFGTGGSRIEPGAPLWNLPRVDAHYVRDPRILRRVVAGSFDVYLDARRLGSRTRRALRKDYAATGAGR